MLKVLFSGHMTLRRIAEMLKHAPGPLKRLE